MFTIEPVLIETVCHVAILFMTGVLIFGLQRTCQTMFVILNEPVISLFITFLRKLILLIPLALLLPRWFGVDGVYLAESVADALTAMTCIPATVSKILQKMDNAAINNMGTVRCDDRMIGNDFIKLSQELNSFQFR